MRILQNCKLSALLSFSLLSMLMACYEIEYDREPQTFGPAGELLVVASEEAWNGPAGDTLRKIMNQPYEVTLNPEPMMDVNWVRPAQFGRYLKPHRNVLILEVGAKQPQQTSFAVTRNRWGTDQINIDVKGSNANDVALTIASRANEIRNTLQAAESRRLASFALKASNDALAEDIQDHWGIQIVWPKDAILQSKSDEFWLMERFMTRRKNGVNHDVTEIFFIHSEPIKEVDQLDPEYIVNRRDEVTQMNVHGSMENSYMIAERRVNPSSRRLTIDGLSAREIQGWWTMENDWMGGPYCSLTILDEKRNRVLTIEGCVYAPAFEKRPFIREVEGLLKRVDFVD